MRDDQWVKPYAAQHDDLSTGGPTPARCPLMLWCLCAHAHACVRTHTHKCIHTNAHTDRPAHTHTHRPVHTHMHRYTHVHIYTSTHTGLHTHIYTHACVHTYSHTLTHTYTNVHTHTQICWMLIVRTLKYACRASRFSGNLENYLYHLYVVCIYHVYDIIECFQKVNM